MIGTLTRSADSGEQLGQGLRVRRCDGVEGAAMPARRCALHGNGVDAAVHRRVRFLDGGHGADSGDARVAEPLALLALGRPNVNDATSGRRSSSTSSLAAQASSL